MCPIRVCAQVSAQRQSCGTGGHQDAARRGGSTQVHKHGAAEPALLGERLCYCALKPKPLDAVVGCMPLYPLHVTYVHAVCT